MSSLVGGVRWGLDRMLAVGYGVLYDYIFDGFTPYRELRAEVMELVASAVPVDVPRRDVHVLDIACGPGNLTVTLAEAGYSVVGVDPYGALVEVAREKRRAQRLANVAFRHGDLASGQSFNPETFDVVVNVHSLYLHPDPERLLRAAHHVLRPGGCALFVNRTRPVNDWSTVRALNEREGASAALHGLLWVIPNSIFETVRNRSSAPHYWDEAAFTGALTRAGFTVLSMRRTFLHGSSLLALVRKETGA